jgi:hypothetical protein
MTQSIEQQGNIVRHDAYHLIKTTQKRLRALGDKHKEDGGSRIDLYVYIAFYMAFTYNEPTSPAFVQKFDASKDSDREPRPTVQKLYALANVLEDIKGGAIKMAYGRDDVLKAVVMEERQVNARVIKGCSKRKDDTKPAVVAWAESVKKINRPDWLEIKTVRWRTAGVDSGEKNSRVNSE